MDKLFPRLPQRIHRKDAFWNGRKKPFAIATTASSLVLQLVFLLNFCYLFGSLFQTSSRVHNLSVLLVDYDHGVIGRSLQAAAITLKAPSFPSIHVQNASDFLELGDVYDAVRKGDYWAAIYTHAGASDRLSAALQGNNDATFYNSSDVLTYIWNEARYAAPSDGYLKSGLEELVQVTRILYNHINGTASLQTMNQKDPAALQVFLNPWVSNSINVQSTTQGTRVLYNTVIMVLPIILQFFTLMALNNIGAQYGLYQHLPLLDNSLLRYTLSLIFTFTGSLCLTGAIWAFKEDWTVTGGRFMCIWLVLWLYMHVNFLLMDIVTAYLAVKFLPLFVLTWVVLNVTSTIFPFELSPAFYRIGYVFPAHETWTVLVQIFSGGAVDRLRVALPILFVYEVVLVVGAWVAMQHRCVKATRAQQEEEVRMVAMMEAKGEEMLTVRQSSVASNSMRELRPTETGGALA